MDGEESGCWKCGGAMVQGFLPDTTHGLINVGQWVAGEPRRSFWTGTKAPTAERIPIGAFRCESCGYLELYARGEFGLK